MSKNMCYKLRKNKRYVLTDKNNFIMKSSNYILVQIFLCQKYVFETKHFSNVKKYVFETSV